MLSRRRATRIAGRAGLVLAGALLWLVVIAPLSEASKRQITMYTVRQSADGRAVAQSRVRYRVWPQSRSVHREYPDRQEYRDCDVIDRRNWRCPAGEGSPDLVVDNGRLNESDRDPGVQQVSRWIWYRALLLGR